MFDHYEGPDVFDCSGFVRWAFLQVGISLQHYSGAMYRRQSEFPESNEFTAGDRVPGGAGGSEHVAIYIGGNQILHIRQRVCDYAHEWLVDLRSDQPSFSRIP